MLKGNMEIDKEIIQNIIADHITKEYGIKCDTTQITFKCAPIEAGRYTHDLTKVVVPVELEKITQKPIKTIVSEGVEV